jgi:hypothetical protein
MIKLARAGNHKTFRRYTFVGQRYCINEDIMKELALRFKNIL